MTTPKRPKTPWTYLTPVRLAPNPRARRGKPGSERVGLVHRCPRCGWESAPCTTLAAMRAAPAHTCSTERFEGPHRKQAALVGPEFTHHDDGGDR